MKIVCLYINKLLGLVMKKLIINFWYGQISLWKSYWIIGELVNAIVIFLIINIEIRYLNNIHANELLPFINFYNFSFLNKVLIIIWTTFITVGIWRAAENYKGNFIWIFLTLLFLSYRIFTMRMIFFN